MVTEILRLNILSNQCWSYWFCLFFLSVFYYSNLKNWQHFKKVSKWTYIAATSINLWELALKTAKFQPGISACFKAQWRRKQKALNLCAWNFPLSPLAWNIFSRGLADIKHGLGASVRCNPGRGVLKIDWRIEPLRVEIWLFQVFVLT